MNTAEILQRFEGLPFTVEVEVGSLAMTIREILALKEGTVLKTDHPSGTPCTLCAGGAPIAMVDVVLVDDALSVRVKNALPGSKAAVDNRA